MSFDPQIVSQQLLAAARRGSGELFRLRRGLTREQAAQVSACLPEIDRAAIRLAMAFGDDGKQGNRWRPFESGESAVVFLDDGEIPSL